MLIFVSPNSSQSKSWPFIIIAICVDINIIKVPIIVIILPKIRANASVIDPDWSSIPRLRLKGEDTDGRQKVLLLGKKTETPGGERSRQGKNGRRSRVEMERKRGMGLLPKKCWPFPRPWWTSSVVVTGASDLQQMKF